MQFLCVAITVVVHLCGVTTFIELYQRRFSLLHLGKLPDCVHYNKGSVILRFVISRFCSIHFTVTLAG